jgi:hypothetical protein
VVVRLRHGSSNFFRLGMGKPENLKKNNIWVFNTLYEKLKNNLHWYNKKYYKKIFFL